MDRVSESRNTGPPLESGAVRESPELRGPPAAAVVAIGASAGGLQAFHKLLDHLPPDTGMAFILIPHLDPTHDSVLSELLLQTATIPVREVTPGARVEPDTAYVIRPNTMITMSGDRLEVAPRGAAARKHECINRFMISLAREYRERAIGVILSGTASDGSLGIEAIRSKGGITFAQDASAQFQDMPRNAVATGAVDYVLPPEGIAAELARISRHPYLAPAAAAPRDPRPAMDEGNLEKIFRLLRGATGVDFASYKRTTVERRLARRMALSKVADLSEYVRHLEENPQEIRTLHDEILIHVTAFFREPAAFEALREEVFPLLVKNRPADGPIRVWVPGCSTGEEAYSIAIALLEYLEMSGKRFELQIFGTDISERAVEKARAGLYESGIKSDVSEERLRRFFERLEGGAYRISKAVRDLCVFARQDVTRDPPFSRLDLLSCRNMLIYLGPSIQMKVIPLFHYALKPSGFLMLGASESVERYGSLFAPVDKTYKIYSKVPGSQPVQARFISERPFPKSEAAKRDEAAAGVEFEPGKAADRILLAHHVPASIVVSEEGQVVEVRGETGPYLRPAPGKPSPSLLKMVRDDLVMDVDMALREARKKGLRVRKEGVRFKFEEQVREVEIEVIPLFGPAGEGRYHLVLFKESPAVRPPPAPFPSSAPAGEDQEDETARLLAELAAAREYQQSVVEKLEAVNEELRSSGEEALSANEELQSTNEELETSKEELQSANEELATLNDELQTRNADLRQLTNDLQNVVSSSGIPLAIVDVALRLRRITPQAEKLLGMSQADVGRRITEFKPALDVPDLERSLHSVIDTLTPIDLDVRDGAGRWYSVRLRPYRTSENRIEGAVMVFVDVDALRQSLVKIEEGRALIEVLLDTVPDSLLILGGDLRVEMANRSFCEAFRVRKEEVEGRLVYDLGNRQWDIPKLRLLLQEIIPKHSRLDHFEVEHDFEGIGRRVMLLHARQVMFRTPDPARILLVIEDITERRRAEEAIRTLNKTLEARVHERTAELESALEHLDAFSYTVSHDLRAPLRAMSSYGKLLVDDYAGKVLDPTAQDYARRMTEAARRMDALVQGLLEYSRLTRAELRPERVDLESLLSKVLEEMAGEIRERRAEVKVDGPLPAVLGHWAILGQVVTNLVSNAVKFVAAGVGPRALVRSEVLGARVRLWVEDNGIGIAREHHERIFGVFERLHKQEEFPGTGIGLAIVRKAIDRMGGRAGVESEPGKGSRFWIELPKG
jgi:two-component system CheB/CheR fusion protein